MVRDRHLVSACLWKRVPQVFPLDLADLTLTMTRKHFETTIRGCLRSIGIKRNSSYAVRSRHSVMTIFENWQVRIAIQNQNLTVSLR